MAQGTIKKLVSDKGFGFIAGDGGELFFHHSSIIIVCCRHFLQFQSVKCLLKLFSLWLQYKSQICNI